jgi:hypothetical protein
MAFVTADRVKETTTTTGSGTLTLAGAATGFQSFAVIGTGNTTYYAIIDSTNNVWETGLGTYTAAGTTLARTTVFANSSGTTSALVLAAGTKEVICTQPAQTAITSDVTILGGNNAGKQAPSGTTAIGSGALSSASFNAINTTAVGKGALSGSLTGASNCAIGFNAGANMSTGASNFVAGNGTGISLSSGSSNTLVGASAGGGVSGNSSNVMIGASAGGTLSGTQNVVVGTGTGGAGTGQQNTIIGGNAGNGVTGSGNVFIGNAAGFLCGAVNFNTVLGGFTGTGSNFDMSTSSGNIAIADGQGNLRAYWSNLAGGNLFAVADMAVSSATAATGTIGFYTNAQQVLYYTTAATANFTLNVRGSSGGTLNNAIIVGQSLTIQFWNTNGATAFYMSGFQIDSAAVTPKWINGTAPVAGNANSIDVYTITIMKTAASTFTALARLDKYA